MMNRPAYVLASLAVAILWSAGAAAQEPPGSPSIAPLWTVHIDEVRPDKAAEFERLNVAENKGLHAILREHGQPITPVYEIVMSGAIYMSMRAKLSFAELD